MHYATIVVVGSLNMDFVMRTDMLPSAGETRKASSFSTGPGGKGANQATACARATRHEQHYANIENNGSLRILVKMVGTVGTDLYGPRLISDLERDGIDTDHIIKERGENTGAALIIVEEGTGENRILITPGANALVKIDQLHSVLGDSDTVELLVLQLEIPLDTVLEIIEYAKARRIDVVLNPAPALNIPAEALNGLSHLILNETEAGVLADIKDDLSSENGAGLRRVFAKFDEIGVHNTIVTLGAQGVCYSAGAGDYRQIPAVKVDNVADTTAAGDTFVGYYAVEIARCKLEGVAFDVEKAVMRANQAAAKTVQRPGAMSSIPWKDEVDGIHAR